ncbi:MAG: hypothetical protein SXA11_07390 [Cyanobacteriota bacterium]|nr:hypothetical protein [Cyanobacteriota bacterium]
MTAEPQIGDRVPGLKNAFYGIMKNYNQAAKEYAIRVTGNDTGLGIYVNGVEFDGIEGRLLLDAKNAGERSFYDVTGSDKFTERIKIPEIVRQAIRQSSALEGSGASGIEWRVANQQVAEGLEDLFEERRISITVKYVP